MADQASLVGSIGVIVETFSLSGTMQKIGMEAASITSGPSKDMGSPLKPLDPKDRELFQSIVNDYYAKFLSVVDEGRPKLSQARVKELADGRVYTAKQALDNGLVDRLGTLYDAIHLAKEQANMAKAQVVIYHRPLGYRGSVYAGPVAPQINLLNISGMDVSYLCRPQFMYLWTGRE